MRATDFSTQILKAYRPALPRYAPDLEPWRVTSRLLAWCAEASAGEHAAYVRHNEAMAARPARRFRRRG